jgi:hypothetical protein
MTTKSPSELWRDHLAKRTRKARIEAGEKIGHLTENEKKTPSQRRSENGRKKLNRGGVVTSVHVANYPSDCHQCPTIGICTYKSLQECYRMSTSHDCKKCGKIFRHPVIPGASWIYCRECEEKL